MTEYGLMIALITLNGLTTMQWLGLTVADVFGITAEVLETAKNFETAEYRPPSSYWHIDPVYVPPSSVGSAPSSSSTSTSSSSTSTSSSSGTPDPSSSTSSGTTSTSSSSTSTSSSSTSTSTSSSSSSGTTYLALNPTSVEAEEYFIADPSEGISDPSDLGSVSYDSATDTWTIAAIGGQIDTGQEDGVNAPDLFNVYGKEFTGDFTAQLTILDVEGGDNENQVGIMARFNLEPYSQMVSVAATPPSTWTYGAGGFGPNAIYRQATNGVPNYTGQDAWTLADYFRGRTEPPYIVRLQKEGDTYTTSYTTDVSGSDSTVWTEIESVEIPMGSTLYLGVFATAGTPDRSPTRVHTVRNFVVTQP